MKQKNNIVIFTLIVFILGIVTPLSLLAADYTYNHSKTGIGITQISNYDYNLTDEKANFTNQEEVWVFTQLNNLSDINNFRVRHDVYQNGINLIASLETPSFSPSGYFWEKTQTWNNFGSLPASSYTIKVMLSIDSGSYEEIDSLEITVLGGTAEYNYAGSETGIDIDEISTNNYSLRIKKNIFSPIENVWIFTELNNIIGANDFQIKHDLYIDGSVFNQTLESPIFYPNGYIWERTQTWNNFGFLPNGDHIIKVSMKIDNGVYTEIDSIAFSVEGSDQEINHVTSLTGSGITEVLVNDYALSFEKSDFSISEEVWIFTELSDITNVDNFKVRYDLYRDQSINLLGMESPAFNPNGDFWNKTETWHNFGYLPAGTHEFRVYLSIDGGAYELLDTVVFNVTSS